MQDRNKGIFYPAKCFRFEDAVLLSVTDASHAASFEDIGNNQVGGHRSQSGRILALAAPDFETTGSGPVMLLSWNSSTIRRVCRSTLQAETVSLLQGSDDAEHVRHLLFHVKNEAAETPKHLMSIRSMDSMKCLWMTDCRSLTDHLCNPNVSEVSCKRLAIDLTALRQEVWRHPNELIGNPTYSDSLPKNASTLVRWISTGSMVSDALTKNMKAPQLDELTTHGRLRVIWESMDSTPET